MRHIMAMRSNYVTAENEEKVILNKVIHRNVSEEAKKV
jgi:hypothetical protein